MKFDFYQKIDSNWLAHWLEEILRKKLRLDLSQSVRKAKEQQANPIRLLFWHGARASLFISLGAYPVERTVYHSPHGTPTSTVRTINLHTLNA